MREQVTVKRLSKASIDEEHDTAIGFGSDYATSGLNDAIKTRVGVRIFEAETVLLVEIFTDQVALQTELRQANAHDDRANQPFAYQVDSLSKDAAEDSKAKQGPGEVRLKCRQKIVTLVFGH